jgi:hypothetical protein
MKRALSTTIAIGALVLAGCGGGGASHSSSNRAPVTSTGRTDPARKRSAVHHKTAAPVTTQTAPAPVPVAPATTPTTPSTPTTTNTTGGASLSDQGY